MTRLVRDLMHRGLITCRQDAALGTVAVMLTQHHVHALVVVDRDRRPIGLISDFDLLAGEWLSADSESLGVMRKLTAGDLMSQPIASVEANTPLTDAARQMLEKDISRLMVTEDGKPAGMIAGSDFVASIARAEKARRETVADVMSDAILVCRDRTPITSAARTMTQAGWRSVLVVDPRGRPLGVVSEMDLLPLLQNRVNDNTLVSQVMHPMRTIDMRASLREAADMMIHNHHHRVVVIDERDPESFPLGIVSSFDIVAEMARPGSVWQS
ncbi:MAG: CBS domain-containing protein [Chloroflexota bacterium]